LNAAIRKLAAPILQRLGLDGGAREQQQQVAAIRRRSEALQTAPGAELRTLAQQQRRPNADLIETFALTAAIAERVLGQRMFDEQLLGALALHRGEIAEMQTGEGKTLAAVPAIVWYACQGRGVHVLTANDYLAQRDAAWMGAIYDWFGLPVAYVNQHMSAGERRNAYDCDITYATANEVGFDYLRDGLALDASEMVLRPLAFAVIDEADSILIDEARIPLVIAGGVSGDLPLASRADAVVRSLHPGLHFLPDTFSRNVQLTDAGIAQVERSLGCGSLFDPANLAILTAIQDALHAHALLRRDVDYIVKNGAVELVDEWKGRVAQDRRWPAGLQSAIEAKEHVALKAQGRILGSITVQNLVSLYEKICGMTGTAATQAEEFWKVYRLPVAVIPTHRPVIREDHPDRVFRTRAERDEAVVEEIRKAHAAGQPVLVGTASVADSERLSARLHTTGVAHQVLNARNHEAEAGIIAQAGALGAVTISTNMAGRGVDILLGGNPPREAARVIERGGLYVIGTTRHEARRIDHQLRGRAGRQGDPGSSRFFLSIEDDLLVRFGINENPDIESVQRTAESQNLEIRQMLWKYESVIEHQRREVQRLRREILLSPDWNPLTLLRPDEEPCEAYDALIESGAVVPAVRAATRQLALHLIDDLWADYLANIAELRGGVHWVQWGGRDPLHTFLTKAAEIYTEFQDRLVEEIEEALASATLNPETGEVEFHNEAVRFERGATWTYLTTDQPFGPLGERIVKGLRRVMTGRK
jgi:preprotein translocase subunit SecA